MKPTQKEGISVIMPTYNQGAYIFLAIHSLFTQTFQNWELIIINDGSTDYTGDIIGELLADRRIRYYENEENEGLGASLNKGMELATFDLIAYLPSDDVYYADHLQFLFDRLTNDKGAILVYSGIKYHYKDSTRKSTSNRSRGKIKGFPLQLVQVLHKKTHNKWLEREALVTDDLDKMFWKELRSQGSFLRTNEVTCEWIYHPLQRHLLIKETTGGGIFLYKRYFSVTKPIRFQSSDGNYIDEIKKYRHFRGKPSPKKTGLKILLVGELAYNSERIYALEEDGHQLYGLWITSPNCFNTIGPLPFGNVEDIPLSRWQERIKEIKPDIIYALLNSSAVIFAHTILMKNPDIPFVWHFKEGPFFCRQRGNWNELVELYSLADGRIYINPESKQWFEQFLSEGDSLSLILDGDLPKKEYFYGKRSHLLSESDGEIHTVVPGRPMGILPKDLGELAKNKIHFHFYGEVHHADWKQWINQAKKFAGDYLHLHGSCSPENWVKELSQYDAGWLHCFQSENNGELLRATWNDLNYPARMTTLAAAGLPMIQKDNSGHVAATYSLATQLDIGVHFKTFSGLANILSNKERMQEIRRNVWNNRMLFTFDYHVGDLVGFFKNVINKKRGPSS